jgi:hypothetical protein
LRLKNCRFLEALLSLSLLLPHSRMYFTSRYTNGNLKLIISCFSSLPSLNHNRSLPSPLPTLQNLNENHVSRASHGTNFFFSLRMRLSQVQFMLLMSWTMRRNKVTIWLCEQQIACRAFQRRCQSQLWSRTLMTHRQHYPSTITILRCPNQLPLVRPY